MKNKGLSVGWCLTLLLATSASAVIPTPVPALTLELTPAVPMPAQTFALRISGTWPDNCTPISFSMLMADQIVFIDLLVPDVNGIECVPCTPQACTWELVQPKAGPLPAGLYQVAVRAVTENQNGEYELLSQQIIIKAAQPSVIPLARGMRVVLLEDDPVDGLRAGQSGTIVCCDSNDCTGTLLVSWDLFLDSTDTRSSCPDMPVSWFSPGSVLPININSTMIGVPFDHCGTVQKSLEGCVTFESDSGKTYNIMGSNALYTELNSPGGVEFDQHLHLQGLLNPARQDPNIVRICPMLSGDIYAPILSTCGPVSAGCCSSSLFPGDRVTLLVDTPVGPQGSGAPGLSAGSIGTVVCCQTFENQTAVFVSWDNWTHGINADTSCVSPVIPYVEDSGWWVWCDEVTPTNEGGGTGNQYVVRFGSAVVRLEHDTSAANPEQTLIGCTNLTVQTNFASELTVTVTAASAAGGDWTGTITPDTVDAGPSTVQLCVRGENVDLSAVQAGADRQLATVTLHAKPN